MSYYKLQIKYKMMENKNKRVFQQKIMIIVYLIG